MAMAFIRKVPTKSGATAVQIIYKKYGQITHIDHIGSAHNPKELDTLVALAKQRLQGNQQSLFPDIAASFTIQLKQSFQVYYGKYYVNNMISWVLLNLMTMSSRHCVLRVLLSQLPS